MRSEAPPDLTLDELYDYLGMQANGCLAATLEFAKRLKNDNDWSHGEPLRKQTIDAILGNVVFQFQHCTRNWRGHLH